MLDKLYLNEVPYSVRAAKTINIKGVTFIPIPVEYKETIVTPKSSRHVEAYWSFTANNAGRSLILPDGRCDIILRYNVDGLDSPIPIITGPATKSYTVQFNIGDCWLGMRLRPENAVVLWQGNIGCAADTVLRGRDAIALLPKLAEISGHSLTLDKFATILETKTLLNNNLRLSRALDALHASGGRIRVEKLASFTGCTSRQLNRMFQGSTGLSTKVYAQLVQFHRALKLIQHERLSITDAAFESGYADQAHLTRAFQRFGGVTPSNLPNDLLLPSLFA